ncbi:MAG: hypothetical protein DKM50_04730 [Candidatus Margulisiibacteriota bacterium]|nr:MAG: hypothetical protein DKM50_04730 [Candidatus Margulisiibacteriota bacterium]
MSRIKSILICIILIFFGIIVFYGQSVNFNLYIADDFSAFTPGFYEKYSDPVVILKNNLDIFFKRTYSTNLEVTPGTYRPLFNLPICIVNEFAKGSPLIIRIIQVSITFFAVLSVFLLVMLITRDVFISCFTSFLYLISGVIAYQATWPITIPYLFNIILFSLSFSFFILSLEVDHRNKLYAFFSFIFFYLMMMFSETGVVLPVIAMAYLFFSKGYKLKKTLWAAFPLWLGFFIYFFIRLVWLDMPVLDNSSQYANQAGSLLFGSSGQLIQYLSRILEHIFEVIIPWSYYTTYWEIGFSFLVLVAIFLFFIKHRKEILFYFLWIVVAALPLFGNATVRIAFFTTIPISIIIAVMFKNSIQNKKYLNIAIVLLFVFMQYLGLINILKIMNSAESDNPLTLGANTIRNQLVNSSKNKLKLNTEIDSSSKVILGFNKSFDYTILKNHNENLFNSIKEHLSAAQLTYARKIKLPPIIITPIDYKIMVLVPPTANIAAFYIDVTPTTWYEYLYSMRNLAKPKLFVSGIPIDKSFLNYPMTTMNRPLAFKYSSYLSKRLMTSREYNYINSFDRIGAYNYFGTFKEDTFIDITHVGAFKPNKLGIYDLNGNAWNIVSDNWENEKYFMPIFGGSAFSTRQVDCRGYRIKWPINGLGFFGIRMVADLNTIKKLLSCDQ